MAVTINGTSGITYPDGTSQSSLSNLTASTTVATTSGTAIDFIGIPSWAKRVTIIFNSISTTGASSKVVRIGSGAIETTGYTGMSIWFNGGTGGGIADTTGFTIAGTAAGDSVMGSMTLTTVGGNLWVATVLGNMTSTYNFAGGGTKTISGTLDRVRITTAAGTDTFDAGSAVVMWE